jgi:endonuclease/exonuclease/phosphatase family metal-dependent hydrolase
MFEATVLTWNVHGSAVADLHAVAAIIRAVEPDVVALQEVQRRQVHTLSRALSMSSKRWAFKHWPFTERPEGLAVASPHRLVHAKAFRLRRAPFWSWKRRVGIDATIEAPGGALRLLDVHLTSHDDSVQRVREAASLVQRAARREPAPIIVGDLNDGPDRSAPAELAAAGWIDAWAAVHDVDDIGATNWTPGVRVGRPPTQRLDYVFAPPGATVSSCSIAVDAEHLDDAAALSDHLPVAATLQLPAPA